MVPDGKQQLAARELQKLMPQGTKYINSRFLFSNTSEETGFIWLKTGPGVGRCEHGN